ncbi:oxidoreductase [Demequina litorisediminis]|uniref:Oxidoreductase n=1 Tax=Demequina litorisediminis TaxID=1849022 RepID=A0ABQ6I8J9_9MICO|nr:oxidoreductase [Demequina litorisediminis]GMA34031.1 hypothetical protein GCM10025876_02350 [Demequina litorisediminis]
MGLFSGRFGSKKSAKSGGTSASQARAETIAHLQEFVRSRPGCEAFIEPPTRVTQTTMVVVAETGEWTRRRVPDQDTGRKVAAQARHPRLRRESLRLPVAHARVE